MQQRRIESYNICRDDISSQFEKLSLKDSNQISKSKNINKKYQYDSFYDKNFVFKRKRCIYIEPFETDTESINKSNQIIQNNTKNENESKTKKNIQKLDNTSSNNSSYNISKKSLLILGVLYGIIKIKGIDVEKKVIDYTKNINYEDIKSKIQLNSSFLRIYYQRFMDTIFPLIKQNIKTLIPLIKQIVKFIE